MRCILIYCDMGKLLTISRLKGPDNDLAVWYFKDAYYNPYSTGQTYDFKWPSDDFPHFVAIHADDLDLHRADIRKWIEQSTDSTVIFSTVDRSYRVYWSSDIKKRNWEHTSEIRNVWALFYFDDTETALSFKLRFSNLVREVSDDHPTKHHGERFHWA